MGKIEINITPEKVWMCVPDDVAPGEVWSALSWAEQHGYEVLDTMETGVEYDTDEHGRSVILLVRKGAWD